MERMRRRLATTGLIVEASLKVQAMVGVLSLPVSGACHTDVLHTSEKVAS